MQTTAINLANVDYHFMFDLSGSMKTPMPAASPYAGVSRFEAMKERAVSLCLQLTPYDKSGVEITGFNDDPNQPTHENVTEEKISALIDSLRVEGGTMLAGPLKKACDLALGRRAEKNQLIVVFTDGQPTDRQRVATVIIEASKQMEEDGQLAILFVQVGDDATATAYLAGLDDELVPKGAKFDIVDATTIDTLRGQSLEAIVNKAFND